MASNLDKKILWQCRMGILELDSVLASFVENHFVKLNQAEKELFQLLLTHEDVDLMDWLINQQASPPDALKEMIDKIINNHRIANEEK